MAGQGIGRQESYREPGEADEWHRPRTLEYTRSQMECGVSVEPIGISGAALEARLHSESEREGAPSGHTNHVRPGDAGSIPARAGTGVRMRVRSEQLRL